MTSERSQKALSRGRPLAQDRAGVGVRNSPVPASPAASTLAPRASVSLPDFLLMYVTACQSRYGAL